MNTNANTGVKPYSKSFDDELDWQLLGQLHSVVLQISNFCFHTKQICLTVDIAVAGILFKITGDRLNHAIFAAGLLIPIGFWFIDSVGYFYQVKLRGLMETTISKLKKRNKESRLEGVTHQPVIEEERVMADRLAKVRRACINSSMLLYAFLAIVNVTLWGAWGLGWFGK